MSAKQKRFFRRSFLALAAALILCVFLQAANVSRYNRTLRSSERLAETDNTYMDIHFRGDETSAWVKRDLELDGRVFDGILYNHSRREVSSWTLQINIQGDCWLNQFWNGEVEVHQHVGSEQEVVQRLNLAGYNLNDLKLEYAVDATDLLIPLKKGDYIVYYPSAAVGETPLSAGNEATVGVIFYYRGDIDLTDYRIDYYYRMTATQGPLFVIICVFAAVLLLLLGYYIASTLAYRRAQQEIDLRVSGISCMAELYEVVYIIDLAANTIIPVGMEEEADAKRPKDLQVGEQMKNLFVTDSEPDYLEMMLSFSDLNTLPERLADRSYITAEYVSRYYGWCRIRFIAMERQADRPVEKILFTIQQINEEKTELKRMLDRIEEAKNESQERRDFLESVSAEVRTPLRSILALDEMILDKSTEENVRGYASEIKQTGEMLLSMVNSTLDFSRLASGKMKLSEAPYSLRELLQDVEYAATISIQGRNIDFQSEISPNVPEKLIGDGPKLKQILINLLARAIGDIETGCIRLRIFGKALEEGKVHLLISVQEMGTHTDSEESGIGMSLVNGLISLMGSSLKTADLGMGRDFYFETEQRLPETEQNANG
ncbi:MAG: HAMP domain-containing histidine kinase [Oscillospiraceae bacterium]|nr:HAMP domain-containing histidine kinase [Oscillospiraceae bacterium]